MSVDDDREDRGRDSSDSDVSEGRDDSHRKPTTPHPDCPRCGTPITMTTATGPDRAVAKPCGCRVPPTALEFE